MNRWPCRFLLGVEDTGYVTIEHRLTNLLFFIGFFCPFVPYCFTPTVSFTPSRRRPVSYMFSITWLTGDVEQPSHLSERVHIGPGVVVLELTIA